MSKLIAVTVVLLLVLIVKAYFDLQTLQQKFNEQANQLANQTLYLNNLTFNLESRLAELLEENAKLKNRVSDLEKKIRELTSRIDDLESRLARNFVVYPTYSEVLNFVQEDDTDKQPFNNTDYSFICTDYTNRFISNFRKKGFYACETILYFPDYQSHSIVAIYTLDKGLIFVEPQNDQIIFKLNKGDNYCNYINQDCNWTILSIKHCFQN
jgi:vacuolar-type H+-ATPase subunit I/STV1